MSKRRVELFIAGCSVCEPVVDLVKSMICDSCELEIYDTVSNSEAIKDKITYYGIRSVPAVAVNGELLSCCKKGGINIDELETAGIGKSIG